MELKEIKKFPSLLCKAETVPVEAGQEVYSWEYLAPDGKIATEKSNLYEKVQSFVKQVEYKKKFERGELENDNSRGLYMDISALGEDYGLTDEYVGYIINRIREDLQAQSLQGQNGKNNRQNSEAQSKGTEVAQQSVTEKSSQEGGAK